MKIIVAVLNWGLGHASRSIPLVSALLEEGFEPILASDGEALLLLRKEFPDLQWLELPSYQITYPRNGRYMKLHFLLKGPQMLITILAEHRMIRKLLSSDPEVVGILSDNRLGAFSQDVPSAYLTHQLQLLSGSTSPLTIWLHQYFINQFSECWIPDLEGPANFTGKMSLGTRFSKPVKYLGILSRLHKREFEKKYDLLVLLSGPEPQRSLLEEILLNELQSYEGKILFIRGKVEGELGINEKGNLKICNYLTGKELETAINSSELVLARSGYSTIMDLAVLGKKAFFIPTPGQYEQEYLAERLEGKNIAPFCTQQHFTLKELEKTKAFTGFTAAPGRRSLSRLFALFQGK